VLVIASVVFVSGLRLIKRSAFRVDEKAKGQWLDHEKSMTQLRLRVYGWTL
jgi:hypothetical protein